MWIARAPSNIALIKYMGKSEGNRPANSSLSYTLDHLVTEVRIEDGAGHDQWLPLMEGRFSADVSEAGQRRFLEFFAEIKRVFKISGFYRLHSGNNFPSDCGLASSASSFAALTKATYELSKDKGQGPNRSDAELSRLSRQGSGSSCRSFSVLGRCGAGRVLSRWSSISVDSCTWWRLSMRGRKKCPPPPLMRASPRARFFPDGHFVRKSALSHS